MGGGVYAIVNAVTGRKYIGSTNNTSLRWNQHLRNLHKNNHINKHLQYAWNKYGADSFTFVVLEEVASGDDIVACEQKWLDKCWAENLYNILPTAYAPPESRGPVSDETRAKMAESHKGSHHTEETKLKIAGAAKRRGPRGPMSEEQRRKLSDALRGRAQPPRSEEHLHNMSLAQQGKKLSPATRAKISAASRRMWEKRKESDNADTGSSG